MFCVWRAESLFEAYSHLKLLRYQALEAYAHQRLARAAALLTPQSSRHCPYSPGRSF